MNDTRQALEAGARMLDEVSIEAANAGDDAAHGAA
jgi:hypothetical protein